MTENRIAVLASGGGRSLENLAALAARGQLGATIALVVTDRPGIGVLERAERLRIPALVVPYRSAAPQAFSDRVFAELEGHGIALVVLAGFLRRLAVPAEWSGRILNIHPALLPAYGGKGFYGERVHRAVLAAGERESGCTVHLVDDEYDHGEVLLQRRVPVLADDTSETLAARVFEAEKLALPEAIQLFFERETPPGRPGR